MTPRSRQTEALRLLPFLGIGLVLLPDLMLSGTPGAGRGDGPVDGLSVRGMDHPDRTGLVAVPPARQVNGATVPAAR